MTDGMTGKLYGVQFIHNHAVDTRGNVLDRSKCDICSDPEVLDLIKQARAEGIREYHQKVKLGIKEHTKYSSDPDYLEGLKEAEYLVDRLLAEELGDTNEKGL